jgi:mannosyltransferase OCH1-like enzyme
MLLGCLAAAVLFFAALAFRVMLRLTHLGDQPQSKQQQQQPPPSKPKQQQQPTGRTNAAPSNDAESREKERLTRSFEWRCSDKCSCLPPVADDSGTPTTLYMHQSYKTTNQTRWPKGWTLFRRTWLEHHPSWTFVFWLDEHNDLLARCLGYAQMFEGRDVVEKADLSRLLYLDHYGGFYADMDYLALNSQVPLLDRLRSQNQTVLLQGREGQVVGLEWGYASRPGHPLWKFCLQNSVGAAGGGAFSSTGPMMLERCMKRRYEVPSLEHMKSYEGSVTILDPKLIAPINAVDFKSTCGIWRSTYNEIERWANDWEGSECRKQLLEQGSFAVTFYTQSYTTWLGH